MRKIHVLVFVLMVLASGMVFPQQGWTSNVEPGVLRSEMTSGPTKEAGDTQVKPVPITLASEQTMKILRSNWLGEVEQGHLSVEKQRLSRSFWTVIAILAVLPILFLLLVVSGTFNRFGIHVKLYTSYGSLVLLAAILGVSGYFHLSRVNGATHLEAAFLKMSMTAREMHVAQNNFLLHGAENKAYGEKQIYKIKRLLKEIQEDFAEVGKSNYLDAEQSNSIAEIKAAIAAYGKDLNEVVEAYHESKAAKQELAELGEKVGQALEEMLSHHEAELARLEAGDTDLQGIGYQAWIVEHLRKARVLVLSVSKDRAEFLMDKKADRVENMAKNLGMGMGHLRLLAGGLQDSKEKAKLREVEERTSAYSTLLKRAIQGEAMIEKDTSAMVNLLHWVEANLGRLNREVGTKASGVEREARMALIVLIGMALVAGSLFSIFIARGIFRPINIVIEGLIEGAEQVAAASGEVSSASQELAEGSAEQAASLAETSACLEEMAATTKQNAEHATQANNLMQEANEVVAKANESIRALNSSMEQINKASEETQEIIKSIDEIAFQTNLLALNAAVEAARAGETGAGFAVVADEVRNLAMRAAEAAKNTENLIEGTVMRVKNGSALVQKTNNAFEEVANSAARVGELVSEIAAASHEQSHGIEQMNSAVTEIDKVAQQNAANAEQSASAAQEMSAQAQELKGMLRTFKSDGRRSERKLATTTFPKHRQASTPEPAKLDPTKKRVKEATHRAVNPEKIIPMEDDDTEYGDFEDF